MSEYDQIIEGLNAHGSRRSGASGWQCPAHDDRNASLSVNEKDGKPLVFCQAGCHTDDVLNALGLSWPALRDKPAPGKTAWIASYEYTDERGGVLFVKERGEPKTFRVYRPLTGGRRQYKDVFGGAKPPRRVLYRLPAVVQAIAEGRPVYLVEGEKDVHSAERAGGIATCNYEGAAKADQRSKWRPEYGDMLKGAHVVIVADNDGAGRAHAAAAYADLRGKAASVRVVRGLVNREKADLTDHLAAGYSLDDLAPLDGADDQPSEDYEEAPPLDPETTSSEEYFEASVDKLLGDLLDSDSLDKIKPLEPLVGDLLALNTLSRVIGPSGTFKSFVLLDMAGHVGTGMKWHGHYIRQGLVVYLVAEGEQGIRKRVRAWEQHHGLRMDNVRFLPRPVQAASPEWEVLIEAMRRIAPALIVIDTQARVTLGVEENSNTEMGKVVDRMDQLRASTGACVTLVHHTGHVGEHGRGASAVKGALQSELVVSRKGDKIANTVLTIKSGKQKDEDQDGDIQFGLRKISLDGEYKPDGRPVTSLVLESLDTLPEPPLEVGSPAWIVQQLDNANVPYTWGRIKVTEALIEMGVRARKEKIEEAIRTRKARAKNLPPSLPPTEIEEPAPIVGAGQEEIPVQTCPGQVGGRSGQRAENLPAPSPSLGMGQVGHTGPTCTACGLPLDAEMAAHGDDRHPGC
ncbi:AAA family ATPase [Streptomyces sp. NPDC014892]|uniref:AAA family ATPase n=1 Tax=Streptomyces sp. NPDC014892 TaxID=3364930 RepID=UPI0036FE4912